MLLGPPGVGKGTQAQKLSEAYRVAHISTGDMFREAVAQGTELGKEANRYMSAGDLVPDEVVIGMVDERLQRDDCREGFLLDGFPRTLAQAEALGSLLKRAGKPLAAVVDLRASEEEIVRRLSGRRVCSGCSETYNVASLPPGREGVCDECGGELIQRPDDRPEAVRRRLVEYNEKTQALTDYYRKQGLLEEVDASGGIDQVFENVQGRLKSRVGHGPSEVGG